LGAKELYFWDWHFDLHRKNFVSDKDTVTLRLHGQPDRAAKLAQREEAKYFKKIYAASVTGSLTVDTTPAYSGLSIGGFKSIRNYLVEADIDYKVVFLLRDPLTRVELAFNYIRDDTSARTLSVDQQAISFASSWHCQFRTRYEMTLSSLFSVFPKAKILVELFENIGSRDAVSFFTESIGLEKRPNPLKYVNGQDYSTRFSTQVLKKIVDIF
jgi:hypothetical protein